MKKICFFIIVFLVCIIVKSQDEGDLKKISFSIGAKTRVTPIYLKKLPGFYSEPSSNILEQPDKHLSGPSFFCSIEKSIEGDLTIAFSAAFRHDVLYYTFAFNNQSPIGFQQKLKKALLTDIYIDGYKRFVNEKSEIRLGLGLSICGIGSSFIKTERFSDNSNQSLYIPQKMNFVFPAATTSFAWKKKRFLSELKVGYCWTNPTLFKNSFLFPELKIAYTVF